jgi:hypothetical protein
MRKYFLPVWLIGALLVTLPFAVQAAPKVIACPPGRHIIRGSAPANSALLLYFDGNVVGGGHSDNAGRYQIPLVIDSGVQRGAYALVVRMRENRRVIEEFSCVVPDSNSPAPTVVPVQATAQHTQATNTSLPTTTIPATNTAAAGTPSPQVADWYPCQVDQIKGNRNSMIYHTPEQRDYARTRENVECFNSEAEALAAGYRKAER